jgi:hypothetical protein
VRTWWAPSRVKNIDRHTVLCKRCILEAAEHSHLVSGLHGTTVARAMPALGFLEMTGDTGLATNVGRLGLRGAAPEAAEVS